MQIHIKFTVYFSAPFWVAVCERLSGDQIEAARIVFGAEPKDYDVYAFVLSKWGSISFSRPLASDEAIQKPVNPKRMQRLIRRQMALKPCSTKSQLALQSQREDSIKTRKEKRKEDKLAMQKYKRELHIEKRKAKKKGR